MYLSGVDGEAISFGFANTNRAVARRNTRASAGTVVSVQYVRCVFGPTGTLLMTPSGCVDALK